MLIAGIVLAVLALLGLLALLNKDYARTRQGGDLKWIVLILAILAAVLLFNRFGSPHP